MLQHAAACCTLLRTWEGARAIACRAVTAFSCFTTSFTIFSFSCAALYGQYGQYGVNTVSIRCHYVANEFWLVILRRTCLTLRNLKTQTSAFGQAHIWSLHILTVGEAPGWTIGENLPGQLDSFAEKRAHRPRFQYLPAHWTGEHDKSRWFDVKGEKTNQMMHTVSSSFFVTGLKRSGFNSFISMPFNATSKYPVWILFLPETHMKAHHPPPQVPASPLFMCFIMITSQHISTPLLSAKVPGLTLPTSCRSFQAIPRYPDKVCS